METTTLIQIILSPFLIYYSKLSQVVEITPITILFAIGKSTSLMEELPFKLTSLMNVWDVRILGPWISVLLLSQLLLIKVLEEFKELLGLLLKIVMKSETF